MTEVEAQMDVSSILQSFPQYKPITVDKDDDLKYDLGHLCAFDYHPIDSQELKNNANYLSELSRDNVQLLFTKIFQLPSKVVPDGVLAELPKATTVLPRSKPLPELKQPTRWEKFAKIKGIKPKSRKPQLVWDEAHQDYRRRYGYMRANNPEDQWVIPQDPKDKTGVDPFTKMKDEKKIRAEKQGEKQQRNKTESKLEKARSQAQVGTKLKDDISRTFALVSRSTASLGKFDRRLPGETEAPKVKGTRKVAGVGAGVGGDMAGEKTGNMVLIDKMFGKEDKVNADKAASNYTAKAQQESRKRNRDELLSGKAFKKPQQKKHGKRG